MNPPPDTAELEKYFLEGPQRRRKEFFSIWRIAKEFFLGFRTFHFIGPCVTVFGSARFKEDHPYYVMAREVSARLANKGFVIMTGGGPGIMEAANRGAKDVGGASVGCNIELPHEQYANPYLDRYITLRYFFVRKVILLKYSYGFVIMPGGAGTMDELFETLTLIQTGKIKEFPMVLMGREYWHHLIEMLEVMVKEKTIAPGDLDLLLITDDADEAARHIEKSVLESFGIKKVPKLRQPRWWLGERWLVKPPVRKPKP
jgi:uncharacterized protein (TIGR00730 family)